MIGRTGGHVCWSLGARKECVCVGWMAKTAREKKKKKKASGSAAAIHAAEGGGKSQSEPPYSARQKGGCGKSFFFACALYSPHSEKNKWAKGRKRIK